MNNIFESAKSSILRKEYVIGTPTKYHVLTIKYSDHHYFIVICEEFEIIAEKESHSRLAPTKELGVELLVEYRTDANYSNTTMCHYKHDRPSGNQWIKDKLEVLQVLFNQTDPSLHLKTDTSRLHQFLKAFSAYRESNEAHYQNQERKYKVEFLTSLSAILKQEAKSAREQLISLISKKQSETPMIRWWDNLLSAYSGYSQRDDFKVFLQHLNDEEYRFIFTSLFEQGITSEIRTIFNDYFKKLFEQALMASSKKNVSYPSVQFLAVFLASYAPDKFTLYKSTEYSSFATEIGINPVNDANERYQQFNQMAAYILRFAKEHKYNVDDLIDVHNMIYLHENFLNEEQGEEENVNRPQNIILYGPPGTGKTYNVINEALKILIPNVEHSLLTDSSRRDEAIELYKKFVANNQVMFCTFHQSFSYEDFVEGIRFNKDTEGYEVRDGVFKRICNAARASESNKMGNYDFDQGVTKFFKMSLGYIYNSSDDIFDYCIDHNVIALGWGDDVDFTSCRNKDEVKKTFYNKYPDGKNFAVEAIERFKHWMSPGDIVVISSGNNWVRAIGKVTGEYKFDPDAYESYKHFRDVEWILVDTENMLPVERILKNKVFSQQAIYKLYDVDLNYESLKELITGKDHVKSQYVLIIDEINRGNISKIFGELITLIEPDKRMGQKNELSVTLPYSDVGGGKFSVPSNLHIIGTMNTADRSIALLDTALRRRFEFREMMPDYSLLPEAVDGINIRRLLQTINDRIEYLYDRDHQIGHAYFITDEITVEFYKHVMINKVIPLLQEYFYENWESIEQILGGAGPANHPDYLLNKTKLNPSRLFKRSSQFQDEIKSRYTVQNHPTNEALIRIYSTAVDDMAVGQEEE